jgi:hypothetical protein
MHLTVLLEKLAYVVFGRTERKVTNVDLLDHVSPLFLAVTSSDGSLYMSGGVPRSTAQAPLWKGLNAKHL